MVLGFTQPLTGMSTRIISWGIGVRCLGLTILPHSCVDCLEIWEPQPPENSDSVQASNGNALHFYLVIIYLKIIKKMKHVFLNIE